MHIYTFYKKYISQNLLFLHYKKKIPILQTQVVNTSAKHIKNLFTYTALWKVLEEAPKASNKALQHFAFHMTPK